MPSVNCVDTYHKRIVDMFNDEERYKVWIRNRTEFKKLLLKFLYSSTIKIFHHL